MINYHSQLVENLQTLDIPVHYEMVLHSGLSTPCISYMEISNIVDEKTDVTDVSEISYQVKVWDNSISTIQEYAPQVDSIMRELGFQRISCQELYDINSSMMQKIMTYRATALETI